MPVEPGNMERLLEAAYGRTEGGDCDQQPLLPEYVSGSLDPEAADAFELHIARCDTCTETLEAFESTEALWYHAPEERGLVVYLSRWWRRPGIPQLATAAAAGIALFIGGLAAGGALTPDGVPVLVAARSLPAHSVLGDGDVTVGRVPERLAEAAAPPDRQAVRGRRLRVPLEAGQPILEEGLGRRSRSGGLAPLSLGARSVALETDRGLWLAAGDRVDLMVTASNPHRATMLAENVRVLGIAAGAPAVPPRAVVSLELSERAASMAVLANATGSLDFVLRPAADPKREPGPVDLAALAGTDVMALAGRRPRTPWSRVEQADWQVPAGLRAVELPLTSPSVPTDEVTYDAIAVLPLEPGEPVTAVPIAADLAVVDSWSGRALALAGPEEADRLVAASRMGTLHLTARRAGSPVPALSPRALPPTVPAPTPGQLATGNGGYSAAPSAESMGATPSLLPLMVDSASYHRLRMTVLGAPAEPAERIRPEEVLAYFDFEYPAGGDADPISVQVDGARHPHREERTFMRLGAQTATRTARVRRSAGVVLVVDAGILRGPLSGLAEGLRYWSTDLGSSNQVWLATTAGGGRLLLDGVAGHERWTLHEGIAGLSHDRSAAPPSDEGALVVDPETIRTSELVVVRVLGPGSDLEAWGSAAVSVPEADDRTISFDGVLWLGTTAPLEAAALVDDEGHRVLVADSVASIRRQLSALLGLTLDVAVVAPEVRVTFDPERVRRYQRIGWDRVPTEVTAGAVLQNHSMTTLFELQLAHPDVRGPIGEVELSWAGSAGRVQRKQVLMAEDVAGSLADGSWSLRFAVAAVAFAQRIQGEDDARVWKLDELRSVLCSATGGEAARKELCDLARRAARDRGED